jgi:hypothetical protein
VKRPALLRKLVVAALCLAVGLGLPLAVRADGKPSPPAEADLILPDCPVAALGVHALFTALELELGHDGIPRIRLETSQERDDVATIEVSLVCQPGASQILLRVRNSPHIEVQRAMDISDLPRRLRARAVALATAELARSTWLNPSLPDKVGDLPPSDAGDAESAKRIGESSQAGKPDPPAPRPATAPSTTMLPDRVVDPLPFERSKRSRLDFAAGPTARWFLSGSSPTFGGRAAVRVGRFQAGADVLYSYDARFASPSKLGLVVAWSAFDVFARERGIWRFSTGPRLAAGAGWARVPASSQGSPLPVPPGTQPSAPADTTSGLYLEGALVAALLARTGTGWMSGLVLEAGLGRGIAPGRDSLQPGTMSNFGLCLLVEYQF